MMKPQLKLIIGLQKGKKEDETCPGKRKKRKEV